MAALPEDFLNKVVADVAAIKGIVDANKVVKERDPIVAACARIAYTQICKYCRRPFHWGERTEYYDDYVGPMLLRSLPVDTQQPIRVSAEDEEVSNEHIRLKRGRLVLFEDTRTDTGDPRYPDIEVTYTGGIKLIEENNTLLTACQMQTIANYHRRDTYGLSETAGEKGIARTPADSGEIIESVRLLLDELIYNGTGYAMDGD